MDLTWLPEPTDFRARVLALADAPQPWVLAVALANTRLNFIATRNLDEAVARAVGDAEPSGARGKPVRLAVLGSCTTTHLHAAIRVGGLRRDLPITVYEGEFGRYWHELSDPAAALHAFAPTAILLALDAHHLAAGIDPATPDINGAFAELTERIATCWRLARAACRGQVIQQTPLPVHPPLLGQNEHRLPGSKAAFVARVATWMRSAADAAGIDLLALDTRAARDGIDAWHDPALWHRAKQEVSPLAAPLYGDLVARLLAAAQGQSAKCLVLDLDNTIWGGVVGDDGVEGLVLGQGSALGEAFAAFQNYARDLSRRGVILAVCSKNDERNALDAFERHPDMVLRRADIACFVANWDDKPTNLRAIAAALNIGLDSLVFVDDNPFERALVRAELPMVSVPEVGDDPTSYANTLADAGHFESLAVTDDDRARSRQYQGNSLREESRATATDLPAYLRGLQMRLVWRRFDRVGLSRIVQLINKTNQFNLTTRRYTEAEVVAVMDDSRAINLQLRLLDRFGDNGIVAVVIGKPDGSDMVLDTWLMSCRVLGRGVEAATLAVVVAEARRLGAARLVGAYRPTAKNGLVREHYGGLGFDVDAPDTTGATRAVLDLMGYDPCETFIDIVKG